MDAATLRGTGRVPTRAAYDLVGDLHDLRPQFDNDTGEDPDEVSEAAVAHTALAALVAATAENYAEFRSQGTCTWPGHQARHSCHDTAGGGDSRFGVHVGRAAR